MVHTSNFLIFSRPKPVGGVYLGGPNHSEHLTIPYNGFVPYSLLGGIPERIKGHLKLFGAPKPNKDMPRPCPYILKQWTEQELIT